MKKNFRKISALVLALAMVLSMSAVAFAADDDGKLSPDGIAGNTDGVWAAKDTPVVQTSAKVTLYKELKAYNPESVTINAPTITYTYTVTAGDANKEIFDNEANHANNASVHAYTKAGILTGIKVNDAASASGTIAWTPADTLNASITGEKNTKELTIDFSGINFTGAGVYRYVVSESVATYESSGVVDGTISAVRYLDVYVKDGSSAGTYDIYGFVCFCNNTDIDGKATPTLSDTPTTAIKTEGFVDGAEGTADQYYTYNVTIGKTLNNDQFMNNHEFPFHVTFANTKVTDNVLPILSKSGTGTATIPALTTANADAIADFDFNETIKIANGGTVTITGIPAGTTVTIDEKNDVTGTIYQTYTTGGTTNTAEANAITFPWDGWASAVIGWTPVTTLTKTANTNEAAEQNYTVQFVNTLLTISPTGVALRVAPYVAILCAGIVLLVVSRKRRAEEE